MTTAMALSKDTILLIAPSEASQSAIQKSLSEAGYDVVVVPNETAAFDVLQQLSPVLVVADRSLSDYGRLRGHKSLKMIPIVAWGEQNGKCDEECIDDIERGADLVLCNQSARELVARVRAILRRKESDVKPTLHTVAGAVQMDLDRHEVRVNGKQVELTPKEFQILRHFMESPSRVFSRQEMLNCVWGEGYALEEHALDVHIHSLRQKIEENPAKPKLIVTVRGIGYKLRAGS